MRIMTRGTENHFIRSCELNSVTPSQIIQWYIVDHPSMLGAVSALKPLRQLNMQKIFTCLFVHNQIVTLDVGRLDQSEG